MCDRVARIYWIIGRGLLCCMDSGWHIGITGKDVSDLTDKQPEQQVQRPVASEGDYQALSCLA